MGAGDEHVGVEPSLTLTGDEDRVEGGDDSEGGVPGGEPKPVGPITILRFRARGGRIRRARVRVWTSDCGMSNFTRVC